MADRIKSTYRYDKDTEELLNKASIKYQIKGQNKLIDKLIFDAVITCPSLIKGLEEEVKILRNQLNLANEKRKLAEDKLRELKSLIQLDYQTKGKIQKLISE